jgi:ribosomal-protein-alanine N-acetyltransferase
LRNRWSEKISVRLLTGDQLEAVVQLEKNELSGWGRTSVLEELGRPGSISLAASEGDNLVGWCTARFFEDEAELLKIGVLPTCRRLGCGTRLMSEVQRRLQDLGVERIYLEVRSENEAAVSFYARLGFTPAARRIRYYSRPTDDALVLRKLIS